VRTSFGDAIKDDSNFPKKIGRVSDIKTSVQQGIDHHLREAKGDFTKYLVNLGVDSNENTSWDLAMQQR
jgi:hypothetical protein